MGEEAARNLVSLIVELPRQPFPETYTKFYHVYEIFSTIHEANSVIILVSSYAFVLIIS